MTDVETVGVGVVSDSVPVSSHGVNLLNGKLNVEDRNGKIDLDQNGKSHGQNGKDVDLGVETKDASEPDTEDYDDVHHSQTDVLVADDRNGHAVIAEEHDDDVDDEDDDDGSGHQHDHDQDAVDLDDGPSSNDSVAADFVSLPDDDKEANTVYVPSDSGFVSALIAQSMEKEAMNEQVDRFKNEVVCKLRALKEETRRNSKKMKELQAKYNQACQARTRQQKEKERAIRERDSERKVSSRKENEYKQNLKRTTDAVDKVKAEAQAEYDRLLHRFQALEKEQQKSIEKVKRTEELVETVTKEKQSVTDQNQQYLRNEKTKMRKELEKEKVNRRQLEDQVNALLEANKDRAADVQVQHNRYLTEERKRKTEQLRAEKACKERDDAVQSLHRKSRLLKEGQDTIHRLEIKVETLEDASKQHKNQSRKLQEALRRKSEFEKEYDVHKKRMREREQRLAEREKQFEQKEKKSVRAPKNSSSSVSPSKRPGRPKLRDQNTRPSSSQFGDPLHQFRNILPFHWIALLLLVLLMISIAQKR